MNVFDEDERLNDKSFIFHTTGNDLFFIVFNA